MTAPRPLHRIFGLSLTDFFRGSDVSVELEIDLSLRQQLLDCVLIRRGTSPLPRRLPDGMEELAPHNLVTFKSYQQSLDGWALAELIGHYVNYRKQASPSMTDLLPEGDFRLIALCVRFPQNLVDAAILRPVSEGVFDVVIPKLVTIRVIVVHQLPMEDHNALLHLFSARESLLKFARDHYRPRSEETSSLLLSLFRAYQEDPTMSVQLDEFVQETIKELLEELPPQKRLAGLTPEERLEGLSPEERLKGMSPEERLKGMSPRQRLAGLSPEVLRTALDEMLQRPSETGQAPEPH